jgi:uncharacterized membrane protein
MSVLSMTVMMEDERPYLARRPACDVAAVAAVAAAASSNTFTYTSDHSVIENVYEEYFEKKYTCR